MPGTTLVGIGLVMMVGETHRAVSKRGGFPEALADLVAGVKANMPFRAGGVQTGYVRGR